MDEFHRCYLHHIARILAIDHGTKRIGLAVTDSLQIIASALDTVPAHELMDYLKKYFLKEEVEGIVIGMPRKLSGEASEETERVSQFVKHIRRSFPEKWVDTVDERFTSKIAKQTLIASGTKKMKRRDKGALDRISATIILQSFLSSR